MHIYNRFGQRHLFLNYVLIEYVEYYFLLILYLIYRVLKRIFITGKMHCDTNIPTKFSQTQDKAQDKENI